MICNCPSHSSRAAMWGLGKACICVISLIGYRYCIWCSYVRDAAHFPELHMYMPELLYSILFASFVPSTFWSSLRSYFAQISSLATGIRFVLH